MKVLAITMAYNEGLTMKRWLAHYGRELGEDGLLVLDHGSDDGSTNHIGRAGRLPIPRVQFDDGERTRFVTDLQRALLTYYDVIIYTDCDELLVADPQFYSGLRDYLERMPEDCIRPVGMDIFQARDREAALDEGRLISEQRKYAWFKSSLCKPLITKAPIRWLPGFHSCDREAPIDTKLFLFHTKNADFAGAMKRLALTRTLPWSEKSLAGTWGHHQRRSDDQWIKVAFETPEALLRSGCREDFVFADLAAEFASRIELHNRMWHCKNFTGPVFQLPDRFRGTF